MKTEAYFIPHCDDENCCLGTFEYECPCCQKSISDTSIWWHQDNIYNGKNKTFNCGNCKESLIVEWDKKEFEFYVRQIER